MTITSARHPAGRLWTLRRVLIIVALVVIAVAATITIGALDLAISWRDAAERDSQSYLDDQRVAYDMIKLTSEQQLAAYRAMQTPQSRDFDTFRARGDDAYREIHDYLFRDLPLAIRLEAEGVKEAHQQFEVAAERTFQLVRSGQSGSALVRLDSMDIRAEALDASVAGLLDARSAQRDIVQRRYEELSWRLRNALIILAIAFAGLGVVLAALLHRLVLRPVSELGAAAERLGEGDADARVPVQAFREFDSVATGFNQMADRIQLSAEESLAHNRALQLAIDHLHETQVALVQHEKLSAMGQMLAGLAHELNNPLSGVLGMAEGLRIELSESRDADARKTGVELAVPLEREALRAKALVQSLLNFARKPADTLQAVDLSSAVATAVGLRRHAFVEASKRLSVDVPSLLYVLADSQKLQHAVVNLMNNALDALVGSKGNQLTIRATATGDDLVVLEFDDDGTGIPDVEAVFHPFFTTKDPGKGTGLGLSLVQRFMNEFGGSASASNRPEGGARITLSFKRVPPAEQLAIVPMVAEALMPQAVELIADPEAILPIDVRKRVLIVDDEPSIREIERRSLTRAGYNVMAAASGIEARDLMLRESFDLVISDLRMPGEMDGSALINWMQVERPQLAATALLVTGDVSRASYATLPFPVSRTIVKPFLGSELVTRVNEALLLPVGS